MGDLEMLKFLLNNGLATVGFLYFLFKLNPTLEKLTTAINALNGDISKRQENIENSIKELRLELNALKQVVTHYERAAEAFR